MGLQDTSVCCSSCSTGVDGNTEIRVSTESWLEKKILMPLLPGIEPATFQWHESTTLQLNYIPSPRVEPGVTNVRWEPLGHLASLWSELTCACGLNLTDRLPLANQHALIVGLLRSCSIIRKKSALTSLCWRDVCCVLVLLNLFLFKSQSVCVCVCVYWFDQIDSHKIY